MLHPLLLLASLALPGDWPQWRGPQGSGVSSESGWQAQGRAAWRAELGLGYSCVSIADGWLYTMGYDEARGMDVVFALDATTGAERWRHEYGAEKWAKMHTGGTNSTPTIAGERVFILNSEGWFKAFDAKKGSVLFERNLAQELSLELPTWGFAASPLFQDDVLYLNVGVVLAVDPRTGAQLWRTTKSYGHAYSTPAVLAAGDTPGLAVFDSEGLVLLDRRAGKELGFQPWKAAYDVVAATPVIIGDGVFVSSGMRKGGALYAARKEGLAPVWESKAMGTKMTGCVLYDGHMYGFDEPRLECITTAGEERWSTRDLGMGALMIADGKLICVSADGELVIAEATPAEFRVLSREKVLDGGVYWTSPVLANGRIYVRNSLGALVCRDHRPEPDVAR